MPKTTTVSMSTTTTARARHSLPSLPRLTAPPRPIPTKKVEERLRRPAAGTTEKTTTTKTLPPPLPPRPRWPLPWLRELLGASSPGSRGSFVVVAVAVVVVEAAKGTAKALPSLSAAAAAAAAAVATATTAAAVAALLLLEANFSIFISPFPVDLYERPHRKKLEKEKKKQMQRC